MYVMDRRAVFLLKRKIDVSKTSTICDGYERTTCEKLITKPIDPQSVE